MCAKNFGDPRRIKELQKILDYAQEKYSVEFPSAKKIFKEGITNIPSKKVVDGIVKEWLIWEEYVTQESFQFFVRFQMITFFKSGTCVTFGSPNLRCYIGNKAEVIKQPPQRLATTVHHDGKVSHQK